MKKITTALVSAALLATSASSAFAAVGELPPIKIVAPKALGEAFRDPGSIITAVVGALIILAAILAFLYLILGGIQWITSGGDKAGVEAARNKITNAIVGLIIVAAAYAIMILIVNFLGLGGALELSQ